MNLQWICGLLISIIVIHPAANAIQERSDKEQQDQTVNSGIAVKAEVSSGGGASEFNPLGPKVMCSFLPHDFIECKDPIDHRGNKTAKAEKGYGCLRFGGSTYEEVEHTKVECTVFPEIECYGPRTFFRDGVPCVHYTDHYFVRTLIYSILLGLLGMDRFALGQTGTAVGKLLTVGGVGVWWIIDIILLVTNNLLPEDGSNWNPYV